MHWRNSFKLFVHISPPTHHVGPWHRRHWMTSDFNLPTNCEGTCAVGTWYRFRIHGVLQMLLALVVLDLVAILLLALLPLPFNHTSPGRPCQFYRPHGTCQIYCKHWPNSGVFGGGGSREFRNVALAFAPHLMRYIMTHWGISPYPSCTSGTVGI